MLPEFKIVKYDYKKAHQDYLKYAKEEGKEILDNKQIWEDIYETYPNIKEQAQQARQASYEAWLADGNDGTLEEYTRLVDKTRLLDWLENSQEVFEFALENWGKEDYIIKPRAEANPFKTWFSENKEKYLLSKPVIEKIKYDPKKGAAGNSRAARNNMIIDISYAILTHPDTAEKIHNPGNFDKIKIGDRIGIITSSKELIDSFKTAYGLRDYNEVIYKLLDLSKKGELEELDAFIKKYRKERNPLSLDTFVYNHRQNMTGGALIGMYANNTTMQAKFQKTGLAIKDRDVFMINGRRIKSLHDIRNPFGELISANCAQFSASSVDNVKDPVLAGLMQNTNTANIAGVMLRAGMSIEEVSLMFTQPIVRAFIEKNGELLGFEEEIARQISSLQDDGGGVDTDIRKILTTNFTREELLANIIKNFDDSLSKEEQHELKANQIKAAILMMHIAGIAEDVSDLTSICRADSPNGAIATSIAGAQIQNRKVHNYLQRSKQKEFTLVGVEDIMQNEVISTGTPMIMKRTSIMNQKMPMLQAFYSLGIELPLQVMSRYFPQLNDFSRNLYEDLSINAPMGILSDYKDLSNKFYKELVIFGLTKTSLFGDDKDNTFDEKRNYYLNEFPKEFLKIKIDNPDIAELTAIKKLSVVNGKIIMARSGRLTPFMRESLMTDFDTLLYMDNPAAQDLAVKLFLYSFYAEGFAFGPNSFGNFFSTNFMDSFPEFVNALRTMKYDMREGTYFDKFKEQFLINHYYEGLVPKVENKGNVQTVRETKNGIYVKNTRAFNDLAEEPRTPYSYVRYNGKLYKSRDVSDTETMYVEVNTYRDPWGYKYNANMTAQEMADIKVDMNKVNATKNINSATSLNIIPLVTTSLPEELSFKDRMANFISHSLSDDSKYPTEKGEALLEDPLCK